MQAHTFSYGKNQRNSIARECYTFNAYKARIIPHIEIFINNNPDFMVEVSSTAHSAIHCYIMFQIEPHSLIMFTMERGGSTVIN